MLDTRDGLRKGGDTGPAIVPGDPKKSLLIKALSHQDDDLKMPPKKKLPDEVDRRLREMGRDGRSRPARRPAAGRQGSEIDIEKGRQFWAFQPPKKTAAAGGEGRRLAAQRHRSLPAGRAGGQGTEARRRRRSADAAAPRVSSI